MRGVGEKINTHRILVGKRESHRPLVKYELQNNIKMDGTKEPVFDSRQGQIFQSHAQRPDSIWAHREAVDGTTPLDAERPRRDAQILSPPTSTNVYLEYMGLNVRFITDQRLQLKVNADMW